MGHKVHPIGLRLGIHRKWKSNWYFDSKNYTKFLHLNFDIEKYFKGFLYFYPIKTLLVNCQIVKLASNQIFIFIFFYRLRRKYKRIKNNFWKTKRWQLNLKTFLINKKLEEIPFNYSKKQNNKKVFKLALKKIYLKNFTSNIIIKKNQTNILIEFLKTFLLYKRYLKTICLLKNIKNVIFNKNLKIKYKLYKLLIFKSNILKINFLELYLKKHFYLNNNIFLNIWLNKISKLKKKKIFYYNIKILFNNNKNNIIIKKKKYQIKLLKKSLKKQFRFSLNRKRFNYKKRQLEKLKNKVKTKLKTKTKKIYSKQKLTASIQNAKIFLAKLTNSQTHLIFINSLSFCKFYYYTQKKNKEKNHIKERFNVWPLQRFLFNKYKYTAIFIKDFIYLAFITILIKNPQVLVRFIGFQFKHLPKNRKQLKLLSFITQTIKILCEQRPEIIGFKFQIKGRLNRRTRTKTYNFKKGNLPIQTNSTRVEYGYSEGFTRSGLIGIKLWIFYKKEFKIKLKKKLLEYFLYSKYKTKFNFVLYIKKYLYLQKKTEKKYKTNTYWKKKNK
jgi:ribosomal protein S3